MLSSRLARIGLALTIVGAALLAQLAIGSSNLDVTTDSTVPVDPARDDLLSAAEDEEQVKSADPVDREFQGPPDTSGVADRSVDNEPNLEPGQQIDDDTAGTEVTSTMSGPDSPKTSQVNTTSQVKSAPTPPPDLPAGAVRVTTWRFDPVGGRFQSGWDGLCDRSGCSCPADG